MALLKQSTAYTRMFLMVQSADHITGLTGASPTVTLSKAGGAFGAAAGSVTEVSSGWYKVALTTVDTGTLGDLAYHITAASGDPTDFTDQVSTLITSDLATPTNITAGTITTVTTVTNQLTAAQIATGVWQDATGGDFTTASSIGKSLYTSGNAPGAASGLALVGSNMGTVTSVSGAVGSVTGNVGGNVVGSVASVTAAVTANMTQIAGSTTAATTLSNSTLSISYGTCSGGTLTTAVVGTLNNPSSLTDSGQLIGRTIIFLGTTGTANMQAQASNITASTTGATPTITFTAMTHAPANGDLFVIL